MKVSIIIPLFNKAPYIRRALDSVAIQTFREFEVLVVNDGSTDGGGELVARYGDGRFRLISQPNAGPGAARNRGIAEACGEYLAFLDADDEWLPGFLETSLALLDRHVGSVAAVASGYIQGVEGRLAKPMWEKRGLTCGVHRLTPDSQPLQAVYLLAYLSPWNTVARAEAVRRYIGFYDREKCLYGEDSYLWLKVLLNEAVYVNLQPLVHFHDEASALSRNLRGPRPVEPILQHPEGLEAACPEGLKDLLKDVLAIRAMKTACMLGYWGRWREGRALLRRFCPGSTWRLPYFGTAQFCATPFGAGAGAVLRLLGSRLRRGVPAT